MNLQNLKTFCTVISEGGMSVAAQKLYLTQPAVSQQIRSLESQLGVKLIMRDVRPSMPTIEGQLLYDHAQRILSLIQKAEVALSTVSQKIEGDYSIGTVNTLGLHFLSNITGLLLKYNPRINLKMSYSNYDDVLGSFEKGKMDAVILADIEKEEGKSRFKKIEKEIDCHLLSEDEMFLVSSTQLSGVPVSIKMKDINRFPVVFFNQMYKSFQRACDKSFTQEGVDFHPVFECNNVGTAKRIIEYGVGWGFLPGHSVAKQVNSQRFRVTRVTDLNYKIGIYLYSFKGPKSQKLAELLQRSLRYSQR